MELKAKRPNSIQFYSITPEFDIISIKMCTLNVTLNPATNAIFGTCDMCPKGIPISSFSGLEHWHHSLSRFFLNLLIKQSRLLPSFLQVCFAGFVGFASPGRRPRNSLRLNISATFRLFSKIRIMTYDHPLVFLDGHGKRIYFFFYQLRLFYRMSDNGFLSFQGPLLNPFFDQ